MAPKDAENVCVLAETQKQWAQLLNRYGLLYLYAMTGFGKTTQAVDFAQKHYKEWHRISAADEGFMAQLADFVQQSRRLRVKTLLLVDDLHWLVQQEQRHCFFSLLLECRQTKNLHMFLLSRAAAPAYLSPLQLTRQLACEGPEALFFQAEQLASLLETYAPLSALPEMRKQKLVEVCLQQSKGYVLGASAFYQRAAENLRDIPTAVVTAEKDIRDFLTAHLMEEWPRSLTDAAVRLSVYETFTPSMAHAILGEAADLVLQNLMEIGSFLHFQEPNLYSLEPFFQQYLQHCLDDFPVQERQLLYETAGRCYEQERAFDQALRCYQKAERADKISEIVIYLCENAEGCAFARIASRYMPFIEEKKDCSDPHILGARVMLAAYSMQPQLCLDYLARLKKMAEEERKYAIHAHAQTVYIRTLIACPYSSAERLKDNLLLFANSMRKDDSCLRNIMPTGNMPSLLNGGLDLLTWEPNKKLLYPIIKTATEHVMGKEGIGIADACMGEVLYEKNQSSKAMVYLTRALSAAACNGSIRVQYAVTAIMSRLFQAEGQCETGRMILQNLRQRVLQEHFSEIQPNIEASILHCALLKQDIPACEDWLEKSAPDEYESFYITMRFQLFTKAQVYTMQGRTLEALHILEQLEEFATLYQRTYFHIELLILKAILLFQRRENWQPVLQQAIELARPYGLVRVFADQGAALWPLWKQIEPSANNTKSFSLVSKEMKHMANLYPNYLKAPRPHGGLSKKETEVLQLMSEGYGNAQIAQALEINLGTVKFHVANILKKLEAENRTVAVKRAQEESLL